jgi:hypothetical protein
MAAIEKREHSNIFLSAPMGGVYNCKHEGRVINSGSKTDGIIIPTAVKALREGRRATVIVPRRSLAADMYARIQEAIVVHFRDGVTDVDEGSIDRVAHYGKTGVDVKTRIFIVCVNSLLTFKDYVESCSYILFDEYSQMCTTTGCLKAKGMTRQKEDRRLKRLLPSMRSSLNASKAMP